MRPSPASRLAKFVVQVGPNRKLNTLVKSYRVGRRKQSIIVPRASGAIASSGNFSFVKISVYRKGGGKGSSPTKWIQAPLAARCTAPPADRVSVGTFNVRTWAADARTGTSSNWNMRGARRDPRDPRSGVHAIAIQEASGPSGRGFGSRARTSGSSVTSMPDGTPRARWVDALPDDAYRRREGAASGPGSSTTRTGSPSSRSGLVRISDPSGPTRWSPGSGCRPPAAPGAVRPDLEPPRIGEAAAGLRPSAVARSPRVIRVAQRPAEPVRRPGDHRRRPELHGEHQAVQQRPARAAQGRLLRRVRHQAASPAASTRTTNMFKFPVRPTPHRRDYIMTLGPVRGSCGYRNMAYTSGPRVASDHFMQVADAARLEHRRRSGRSKVGETGVKAARNRRLPCWWHDTSS